MILNEQRSSDFSRRLVRDVDAALKRRGVSARQASIAVVGHDGLIRDIRNGRLPSVDRIEALANFLGLDFYLGPPRAKLSEAQGIGPDFVRVPRYDARLAAGPGAGNANELPSSSLAFRTDWLARIGINPRDCCIVAVSGESMEPTLYDGDLVMIDRKLQSWRTNRLFAFVNSDGDAQVKRVRVLQSSLVLQSDNRDFEPVVVSGRDADQLSIIGQVVWAGHSFER